MIVQRVKARPSLGTPGQVWIEIHRCQNVDVAGAILSRAEAIQLAGLLLIAVEETAEGDQR